MHNYKHIHLYHNRNNNSIEYIHIYLLNHYIRIFHIFHLDILYLGNKYIFYLDLRYNYNKDMINKQLHYFLLKHNMYKHNYTIYILPQIRHIQNSMKYILFHHENHQNNKNNNLLGILNILFGVKHIPKHTGSNKGHHFLLH